MLTISVLPGFPIFKSTEKGYTNLLGIIIHLSIRGYYNSPRDLISACGSFDTIKLLLFTGLYLLYFGRKNVTKTIILFKRREITPRHEKSMCKNRKFILSVIIFHF